MLFPDGSQDCASNRPGGRCAVGYGNIEARNLSVVNAKLQSIVELRAAHCVTNELRKLIMRRKSDDNLFLRSVPISPASRSLQVSLDTSKEHFILIRGTIDSHQ